MCPEYSLDDELNAINNELHNSYERLSALLEKSREELHSREVRLGDFARKNLTAIIRKLELKLGELKELGAAHK